MTLSLAQSIKEYPDAYKINQAIRDLITNSAIGNMPCTEVAAMNAVALAKMIEAAFPDNTTICSHSIAIAGSTLQTLKELSEADGL